MKIFTTVVLLTICAIILSGCLPVEEPILPPPVTAVQEGRVMRTLELVRGDVMRFSNPIAQYLPLRQQALHFTVAGRRIHGVFVSVGDEVREGDILAELVNPDIFDQLRDANWSREWIQLQLTQLNERHNFSLSQAGITGIPIDDSHYLSERVRLQDEIGLAQMRIANIEREIYEMQIRAPFDGVVTWVMDFSGVMWSAVGQAVVTIADQGQYIFRLENEDATRIVIGQYYDLNIGISTFPAIAIDPDTTDIVRPPTTGGVETPEAFFMLVGEEKPLIAGTVMATVFILHEIAEDVIYLPSFHIHTVGDRNFVHLLENDIIVIRDVVLGLVGNTTTEILYGLEEGDLVVLS